MKIPQEALIELHLLRNRLEAGESPLQAVAKMKAATKLPENFTRAWRHLERSMTDGRVGPVQAISEFTDRYQKSNDLADMIEQKSMGARLQSTISMSLCLLVAIIAPFFFPEILRPTFYDLLMSASLLALAWFWQKKMLERFQQECFFLDWLHFFRGLSLSLQMGMILPRAIQETQPPTKITKTWPLSLHNPSAKLPQNTAAHWKLAESSWKEIQRLYESGHPLSKLILHLSEVQEKSFRREILLRVEKLSYKLMLPLFLLCLPAMLWIFFSPLLKSLSAWIEI